MRKSESISHIAKKYWHINDIRMERNNDNNFFLILMLRFGKTKVAKEEFKRKINQYKLRIIMLIILLSQELTEMESNSKYLVRYLNDFIRTLVLVLPKMSAYDNTFKDKDENNYNKLMSFCIEDDKLLRKYRTIWTKIEDLQSTEINTLLVYNDTYIEDMQKSLY